MNEHDLRSMVHRAIGDTEAPGYLESQTRQALKRSLANRPSHNFSGVMAMTAALLAFAIVAVLVGPRVISSLGRQSTHPVAVPTATTSPVVSPSAFLGFSCRLPVFTYNEAGPRGGFITLPGGSATFDPQTDRLRLAGGFPPFYDSNISRWLPVGREAVSPDDSHYAFGSFLGDTDTASIARKNSQSHPPTVHVVDIATGGEHVFNTPKQPQLWPYQVFNYAAQGIYLIDGLGGDHATIWLMSPSTGAMVQVAQPDYYLRPAGGQNVWTGHIDPGEPFSVGTMYSYPDRLDLYSIADHSRVTWLHVPGKALFILAIDAAGHPIVKVWDRLKNPDPAPQVLLLTGPGQQQTIVEPPGDSLGYWSSADSHGVWFGGDHGIYLYTPAYGVRKVSDESGIAPAGACA